MAGKSSKLWIQGQRRKFKVITPLAIFAEAAGLPGKALAVLQLVYLRVRLEGKTMVQLSEDLLRDCGIGRRAEQKALRVLDAAGLVRVYRQPKAATFVGIPDLPVDLRKAMASANEPDELPEELLAALIVKPGKR